MNGGVVGVDDEEDEEDEEDDEEDKEAEVDVVAICCEGDKAKAVVRSEGENVPISLAASVARSYSISSAAMIIFVNPMRVVVLSNHRSNDR